MIPFLVPVSYGLCACANFAPFAALSADGRVVTWGEERTGGDSRIFHSQLVEVGGTHTQNARKTEVFHLIRRKGIPYFSICTVYIFTVQHEFCILLTFHGDNYLIIQFVVDRNGQEACLNTDGHLVMATNLGTLMCKLVPSCKCNLGPPFFKALVNGFEDRNSNLTLNF